MSWPYYENDVIEAVTDVLRSGKINQWTGTNVKEFEKEFAQYVGTKYAIALTNGTAALEIALHVLGITDKEDEVIVTPRTFLASGMAVAFMGATPVFVDIDKDSQNITLETLLPHVTEKTKAIICVHLAGLSCDLDPIMKFANEKGIYVIEDCAQSHGAMYKGKKLGSFGHINAWSFCQDKIMSTGGEGGMLTLNDEVLFKKAWSFKDHGKDYDLMFNNNITSNNLYKWVHTSPGTNMRMTEMQAAIGRVLLKKLDSWIITRRRNADILKKHFSDLKLIRLSNIDENVYYHSYYKFYVFIKKENLKEDWSRERIIDELNNSGVKCSGGSCSEIYLEKAFDGIKLKSMERLPNAKELGETSIMFLVHPTLNEEDMEKTGKICRDIFIKASKI